MSTPSVAKRDAPSSAKGSYWADFLESHSSEAIAKQLLQDGDTLNAGGMPSQLAMHIPLPSSTSALKIATHLYPPSTVEVPQELKRFLYEKIRTRLRSALEQGELTQVPPLPADGYLILGDLTTPTALPTGTRKPSIPEPTPEQATTAFAVLRYLSLDPNSPITALHQTISTLSARFNLSPPDSSDPSDSSADTDLTPRWSSTVKQYHTSKPPTRLRLCYICRYLLLHPHPRYLSLCRPCGAFNYAGQSLSLPTSLNLSGKTALVTGARVNLGYATALRLLRCGATVIATSRYPNDAAVRYSQEGDFAEWKGRLRVVGADFRSARDAFALVKAVEGVLKDMKGEKLDVLVNNAAQTLTDSVKKEERAVEREREREEEVMGLRVVVRDREEGYVARVRGGVGPLAVGYYGGVEEGRNVVMAAEREEALSTEGMTLPDNVKDDGRTEIQEYFKSSWVQKVDEIPYEDIISAFGVNTFVPLILYRELLPLMGAPVKSTRSSNTQQGAERHKRKPLGYIVNVSSREGIFESSPDHTAKNGAHVHTNMTKAAVNMITQTEAVTAWRTRGVAMNTVDPGYISAAPEMDSMYGGIRPLDWEDGAGRVLWPVAIGEVEEDAVWGRFLKHYGAIDVDSTGVRRG